MSLAFGPSAFRRVCVAVLKSRTISSWQSAQLWEPTNAAPGIAGGTITVRWTVEQEITTTAARDATAPVNNFTRCLLIQLRTPPLIRSVIALMGLTRPD